MIKNGLAVIGVLSIVAIFWAIYIIEPAYHRINSFDEKALTTYQELFENILDSGDVAQATVFKIQVKEGVTVADVEKVIQSVANKHNINNVAALSLHKQIETSIGRPFRFVKTYMFCSALTIAKMVRYSDALSSYLPCRVTLLEDKLGKLWLYSLNMDLMIHGGTPLPDELKQELQSVKKIIFEIINNSENGKF